MAAPLIIFFRPFFSSDVLFSGDAIYIAEALSIMTADLTLALIAVAFVGLFMLVHTRSPLVAIGGLLQILLSFPCALYLYAVWFQIELFGALHVLSIFLCLSIGADDIFLIADAFAQFGTFENLEERLLLSFGRALRTMTLTTVTTSIALLLVSLSAVPAIRFFGVFTGRCEHRDCLLFWRASRSSQQFCWLSTTCLLSLSRLVCWWSTSNAWAAFCAAKKFGFKRNGLKSLPSGWSREVALLLVSCWWLQLHLPLWPVFCKEPVQYLHVSVQKKSIVDFL